MRKGVVSVVAAGFAVIAIAAPAGCSTFGEGDPATDGGSEGASADSAPEGAPPDGPGADARDAGSACLQDCAGRTACTTVDFDGTSCPAGVNLTGTTGKASCTPGGLVIDVAKTEQAFATFALQPLADNVVAHVTVRGVVEDWLGDPARNLVQISAGPSVVATVKAATTSSKVTFELCGGITPCGAVGAQATKNKPFDLDFVVRPDGTGDLAIDCGEVAAKFSAANGAQAGKNFQVVIGGTDGNPLKGTFTTILVWFESR